MRSSTRPSGSDRWCRSWSGCSSRISRWGTCWLPAGTRVAPCIYLTNRNPAVYEQPLEFRPERFLGRRPDTFAWIPFGGGIRRCIGASFAQLEMKLMLQTMLGELAPARARERAVAQRRVDAAAGDHARARGRRTSGLGAKARTAAAAGSFPPVMTADQPRCLSSPSDRLPRTRRRCSRASAWPRSGPASARPWWRRSTGATAWW